MNLTSKQPYRSLDQLCRTLRVVLPAPRETWRLVRDPLVGEINGLARFRGATIATNGILVLLRNELNHVYVGHLAWFIPDAEERNAALSDLYNGAAVASQPKRKLLSTLSDYYDL